MAPCRGSVVCVGVRWLSCGCCRGQPPAEPRPRPRPDRALTTVERQAVLDLMREPRFADLAPAEIYATLLDQGLYYCSVRTMYRILDENSEVRERRNQLTIQNTRSQNFWPMAPTKSGHGISPS